MEKRHLFFSLLYLVGGNAAAVLFGGAINKNNPPPPKPRYTDATVLVSDGCNAVSGDTAKSDGVVLGDDFTMITAGPNTYLTRKPETRMVESKLGVSVISSPGGVIYASQNITTTNDKIQRIFEPVFSPVTVTARTTSACSPAVLRYKTIRRQGQVSAQGLPTRR